MTMSRNITYSGEKRKSLPNYKKWKLKLLEKDFCIKVSPEEKEHINDLKTEMEVDRYAHKLLDKAWN